MTGQRPSVIVAAAERDVASTLNGAAQLLFAAEPDSGKVMWFGEMAAAIRTRLARAVDEVRAAEVPVRGEFPGIGGE